MSIFSIQPNEEIKNIIQTAIDTKIFVEGISQLYQLSFNENPITQDLIGFLQNMERESCSNGYIKNLNTLSGSMNFTHISVKALEVAKQTVEFLRNSGFTNAVCILDKSSFVDSNRSSAYIYFSTPEAFVHEPDPEFYEDIMSIINGPGELVINSIPEDVMQNIKVFDTISALKSTILREVSNGKSLEEVGLPTSNTSDVLDGAVTWLKASGFETAYWEYDSGYDMNIIHAAR